MGTSYDSVHGIGYELNISEEFINEMNESDGDMFEHLEELFKDCKVGEYKYAGFYQYESCEEMSHYLFIKDPFENGVDGIGAKAEALQDYVIVNQIEVSDNGIGIYGEVNAF